MTLYSSRVAVFSVLWHVASDNLTPLDRVCREELARVEAGKR
jgi:hypothetical protein